MSLIVSYSGLRGIVGESLTEDVAFRFARAFGRLLQLKDATILLGRDTRPSGVALQRAVAEGLASFGRVVDLGVVATPTLQFAMQPFAADAAVCITASHNPQQWNGMKFFTGARRTVLDGTETKALYALFENERVERRSQPQMSDGHEEAVVKHVARVLQQVDAQAIAHCGFKVALDSARGAGAEAAELLLKHLGCDVFVVSSERESEPVPEQLGALVQAVVGCDVGFAQDLDADRLALVTETGAIPGEEATLVLATDHLLAEKRGLRVVTNSSTTRAVADVVAKHGGTLLEVPVGEVHLSKALIAGADFGGEGNGGVIFPPVSFGRDSLVGMAVVLEALAKSKLPLSQRLAQLPHYVSRKLKLQGKVDYDAIVARFPDGTPSRSDGLKIVFSDGAWLTVRPSNTEPVVRVTIEARSLDRLDALAAQLAT